MSLLEDTPALGDPDLEAYDGVLLVAAHAPIQPFRIQDHAMRHKKTNFIVGPRFSPHAIRDGTLITGQQHYSGCAAARLMIQALGV